jgi:hypothetical protein
MDEQTIEVEIAEQLREAWLDADEERRVLQSIQEAIAEADSPFAEWVSQEEVEASWAKMRAEYLRLAGEPEECPDCIQNIIRQY